MRKMFENVPRYSEHGKPIIIGTIGTQEFMGTQNTIVLKEPEEPWEPKELLQRKLEPQKTTYIGT